MIVVLFALIAAQAVALVIVLGLAVDARSQRDDERAENDRLRGRLAEATTPRAPVHPVVVLPDQLPPPPDRRALPAGGDGASIADEPPEPFGPVFPAPPPPRRLIDTTARTQEIPAVEIGGSGRWSARPDPQNGADTRDDHGTATTVDGHAFPGRRLVTGSRVPADHMEPREVASAIAASTRRGDEVHRRVTHGLSLSVWVWLLARFGGTP